MSKEQKSLVLMEQCLNFEGCNAPKCPLDILSKERTSFFDESKCITTKRVRLKIGINSILPNMGLKGREAKGILLFYPSIQDYAFKKWGMK